ncbi:MAG: phage tail sheath subtilisin-like domain-containing protein [Marmoricola sp.]
MAKNAGQAYGLADADLFNLTVCDTQSGTIEVFRNVSLKPGARQVDKVLANQSQLVQVRLESEGTYAAITAPAKPPTAPKTKTDIWQDDTQSTGVAKDQLVDDGLDLEEADFIGPGLEAKKQGLYALEQVDLFNLLCLPPLNATTDIPQSVWQAAAEYCKKRRAMLIIDPPASWADKAAVVTAMNQSSLGVISGNAMLYFPRLIQSDLLHGNQLDQFVPCGAVAGVIARTDAQRGVWKAPAGLDATLNGVAQLSVPLTDSENGELNPLGVNCLRTFPAAGQVVWGARTLRGDNRLASEWKYIPVRRLALFIEESLYRGIQWAVFEPNDEPLWAQLRLNIGAFMYDLFRQGAFQGQKPQDAYFVSCDSTTTMQNDIDRGIVNVIVGFAPLKPAEFVILSIQQIAGQIAV